MSTFLVGLNQMSDDEKIVLTAQMRSMVWKNVFNEVFQKGAHKTKVIVFRGLEWVTDKFSEEASEHLSEWNSRTEWDPEVMKDRIEQECEKLSDVPLSQVEFMLRNRMIEIADLDDSAKDIALANGIIQRAAKNLDIDHKQFLDTEILENTVFERCIEEQVELLKTRLNAMTPEEIDKFEEILREEIKKLSEADQEAIRQATGIDELSAKAMMHFLKTTSGVAVAQMLIGATGIGAYLFLTTTIKAIGLLMGVTFSFGAYTTASSTLAFLTSAPFLIIVMALGAGWMYRRTEARIKDQLAKILIVVGRAKLLGQEI